MLRSRPLRVEGSGNDIGNLLAMAYQPATDAVIGVLYLPVPERRRRLLDEPLLGKGTAFTDDKHDALGIRELFPAHFSTLDEQVERAMNQLADKNTNL